MNACVQQLTSQRVLNFAIGLDVLIIVVLLVFGVCRYISSALRYNTVSFFQPGELMLLVKIAAGMVVFLILKAFWQAFSE